MICTNPECLTPNPDTNKFCVKCGQKLPMHEIVPTSKPNSPKINIDEHAVLDAAKNVTSGLGAIVGSLIGIIGGAGVIIGWFLPWVQLGGLLGAGIGLLNLLGGGNQLGGLGGLGNGLQIFLGLLGFAFVIFGLSSSPMTNPYVQQSVVAGGGVLLGLFALILACVVIALPIMGLSILRSGIKTLDLRTEMGKLANAKISARLMDMRKKAVTIFVILAIVFIGFAALPFGGTSLLGPGFITMAISALAVFIGALLTRSMMGSTSDSSPTYSNAEPAFTTDEIRVTKMLAQGKAMQDIAASLELSEWHVGSIKRDAMTKLGAKDDESLIGKAIEKGMV
jgi:DNA-binding CsgD family transcriptional regulator